MEDVDLSQEWALLLGELDRHVSSGRLSPDTATLSDLMRTYQVPGVSIAVGHVSGRLWATGYGVTGGEASTPVTAGTAFAACSISKQSPRSGRCCWFRTVCWIWMPTSAGTSPRGNCSTARVSEPG